MRTFTASTLAFLLVLAPTVPAMADSGGDIDLQAQAAKARAAHRRKTGEAGRSDEEGQENC